MPEGVILGFPAGSAGKESACNVGDLGLIPGLGRSPGEENGYPLQYSDLENSMGYIVHGVTKGWKPLSDFHFHFQGFPGGSDSEESASNARDASLTPGPGSSSGEGNSNPL